MPLFRYRALTDGHKKISGVIDADSYAQAKDRLRKQQMLVTEIALLDKRQNELVLDHNMLLAFTRELGQLLKAGLPVYESLLTVEEKYRNTKAHPLFLDLCDRIKNGSSLSVALKKYPKSFDEIYLSMITAAEEMGYLPEVFEQLSQLIARGQKLKKQIISALIYPGILGGFCILVIFTLLFFVIPSLQELFEGRSLHPLTSAVLSLSQFVRSWGLLLILLVSMVALGAVGFFQSARGRLFLEGLLLKVPFLNRLIIQTALIRFCRALSSLLSGGVNLLDALRLSRKVMKHHSLEQVIERAEKKIVEGRTLSAELKSSILIPKLVVRMLAIAEETGRTVPMLQNIVEIYDEELERSLNQFTVLLQPMLLIFLGGIVGVILLSVLLPLTDVSSFLST